MTGQDVALAQTLLSKALGRTVKADGIFGENTVVATKDAQRKFGILIDGAIGPNTWQKLLSQGAPSVPTMPIPSGPVVSPTPAFQITEQGETKINSTTLILGIGILGLLYYFKNRKKRK